MLMERGGVCTLQWEQRVFQGAESAGVWFFPYLNVRCVGYCILSKHTWIEASLSSVIKSNSIRVDLAKLWFPAVCSLWLRVIHTLKNTITTSSVSVCLCAGREAHEEINITFTLPVSWSSDECVLHGHCEQVVFSTCMTITATSNIFPVTVWVGRLPPTPERAKFRSHPGSGSALQMKLNCV